MIKPFEINLEKTTEIYNAAKAAGIKMRGWSPEEHQNEISAGRKSSENIIATPQNPGDVELLRSLGFESNYPLRQDAQRRDETMIILVQKHGLWPRDRYEMADEAGQMEMDLAWLNAGGHLSEEKMDQLANAGKIAKNWR